MQNKREENVKSQAKNREREREESKTFGFTQKVTGLNSIHMFHIGPVGNFPFN